MHRLVLSLAVLACIAFAPRDASAEKRIALVIGNGAYEHLTRLANPTNDASQIASLFRQNGFEVFEHHDLEIGGFSDAVADFADAATNADVAVVFYAGHGMEVGGRNIIAPIDAEMNCETARVRRALPVQALFDAVSGVERKAVILDACRNDPFPQCSRAAGAGTGFRGLSRIRENRLLIANSTSPGELAADGAPGDHSPFASALIARLKTGGGRTFRDIFDEVAFDVASATGNRQLPEITARGGAPGICLSADGCGGPATITAAETTSEPVEAPADGPSKQIAVVAKEPDPEPAAKSPRTQPAVGTALSTFTLDYVRDRGSLNCGVIANGRRANDAHMDFVGNWSGFDADICRAVAAAVLGDPEAVRFVPLTVSERSTMIATGEIDMLARAPESLARSGERLYAGTSLHDGLGFLVGKDIGINSVHEAAGAAICMRAGTTEEAAVMDYFSANNLDYTPVLFDSREDEANAYFAGRCDLLPGDMTELAFERAISEQPDDHLILPEMITTEDWGPMVGDRDDSWPAIVGDVLNVLILAEEKGVTQERVQNMLQTGIAAPQLTRLLGMPRDAGARLGLDANWAVNAIAAVGNYGEVYERTLGTETIFALPRGANLLRSSGGLVYARVPN